MVGSFSCTVQCTNYKIFNVYKKIKFSHLLEQPDFVSFVNESIVEDPQHLVRPQSARSTSPMSLYANITTKTE